MKSPDPYVYAWAFVVRPERQAEFERIYCPEGAWVQLFRKGRGYIDTLLLKDRHQADRYLTVDRWESEAAYRAFRQDHAAEYAALDASCEGLTIEERLVGEFGQVAT